MSPESRLAWAAYRAINASCKYLEARPGTPPVKLAQIRRARSEAFTAMAMTLPEVPSRLRYVDLADRPAHTFMVWVAARMATEHHQAYPMLGQRIIDPATGKVLTESYVMCDDAICEAERRNAEIEIFLAHETANECRPLGGKES